MGRVEERPGHQLFVGPVLHFVSSQEMQGHEVSSWGNVVARKLLSMVSKTEQMWWARAGGREGGTFFQVTRARDPWAFNKLIIILEGWGDFEVSSQNNYNCYHYYKYEFIYKL